jgi:serine phosphatase RsbU (regulator of sigma subunit)
MSWAEQRLQSLQAVTDIALTRLQVEDLLEELLTRVREILDADTAAVLLLDEGAGDLVATAAVGLEEEVRLGVRVPLGRGFAGTIAARKRPVLLDRIDATTVANPILWEKGIQVMLGVPLMAGNQLIGVLHVGRLRRQPFRQEDSDLLQIVADRVAAATLTRRLAVERAAAALLERSLLPGRPPVCPGLEFDARYLTPEDRMVGGDWYDLFVVPSGDLWVVTGDVAGHGLPSAVVMGRARSTVRSYALLGGTPEEVLSLTDRKVAHFDFDTLITAICATSSPPYEQFRIANAGHLPPVMAAPREPGRIIALPPGQPLGVSTHAERAGTTVALPEGGVILFYTDGLIERRTESIDDSLERLRQSIIPLPAGEVCRHLIDTFLGKDSPEDDVALVAIRRVGSEN